MLTPFNPLPHTHAAPQPLHRLQQAGPEGVPGALRHGLELHDGLHYDGRRLRVPLGQRRRDESHGLQRHGDARARQPLGHPPLHPVGRAQHHVVAARVLDPGELDRRIHVRLQWKGILLCDLGPK